MPQLTKYPSVTLEGIIMHPDVLDEILQTENRFSAAEISAAYVDSRRAYESYMQALKRPTGFDERRAIDQWARPFFSILDYHLEEVGRKENGSQVLALSHQDTEKGVPVHLRMHYRKANEKDYIQRDLDTKEEGVSAHAQLQQYLNSDDAIYGLVFNGSELRLLRDAVRMTRLSYVAFNLAQMFEQDLFADFTLLYKLLHRSMMPSRSDVETKAPIENYYHKSLESSSKIREKLAKALADTSPKAPNYGHGAITELINGMIKADPSFLTKAELLQLSPEAAGKKLFEQALALVYRFLFLSVVEERDLTHAPEDSRERELYMKYYSLKRLRKMVIEGRYLIEPEAHNLWEDMLDFSFNLFVNSSLLDNTNQSKNLKIVPLSTGIWAANKLDTIRQTKVKNEDFIKFLEPLSTFQDERKVTVPINYGALDVEELGSIYEGLLDLEAQLVCSTIGQYEFKFTKGKERGSTGSHYTPEALVQPLLQHSLDYLIAAAMEKPTPAEKLEALLMLKIIDPACGSGHILLSAARRLAMAVAKVEENSEQPTEKGLRAALRKVIARNIYGIDINPMALELCKMALWLEAHAPGQPLNFLDHHLTCGDALVGLVSREELQKPIPDAAYNAGPNDDKDFASSLKKSNKLALSTSTTYTIFADGGQEDFIKVAEALKAFNASSESNADEVNEKANRFKQLKNRTEYKKLENHADALIAPFFLPKNKESKALIYTSTDLKNGLNDAQSSGVAYAKATRKFLHWFLAFPDVMREGGFDVVVGNPPFLGDKKISGNFGKAYLDYLTSTYENAGSIDMVGYFFRKANKVVRDQGFFSFISTNTIAQGATREGSLDQLYKAGTEINHAVRSMRWPGVAAVEVALVTCYKGTWQGKRVLNTKEVNRITPYLDTAETVGNPIPLKENENKAFIGSYVLGTGFVMAPEEAAAIISQDHKYAKVLRPYLNGEDLNSRPDQSPSRWVINFYNWPLRRYSQEEWETLKPKEQEEITIRINKGAFIPIAPPDYTNEVAADYPICLEIVERLVKPERDKYNPLKNSWDKTVKEQWWLFGALRVGLYKTISSMQRVMVVPLVSKYQSFEFASNDIIYMQKLGVIADERYNSFTILQSTIKTEWSWKYCSTLGAGGLNYSPTDAFRTFPFPTPTADLERIGEAYHTLRQSIMLGYQIGLTTLYNLFHSPELLNRSIKEIGGSQLKAKKVKGTQGVEVFQFKEVPSAIEEKAKALATEIEKLRALHIEMDTAVRDAYGWQDLALGHGFHEVDYLPENDRIRFTISEAARVVVLERLLKENFRRGEKNF